MGESRIKRFSDLDEARAWAINNREKLWGIEIYELPNGGAFANFVPTEANVLFQQEPRTLPEMIRRVEYIKKLLETEKRPEVRYRMQADIRSLDARIGVPDFSFTDAPQASSVPTIAPPPDMRPNLQPGQVELLFGGQDAGTSDRPGRVSDATAGFKELKDLEQWMNAPSDLPLAERLAESEEQFPDEAEEEQELNEQVKGLPED